MHLQIDLRRVESVALNAPMFFLFEFFHVEIPGMLVVLLDARYLKHFWAKITWNKRNALTGCIMFLTHLDAVPVVRYQLVFREIIPITSWTFGPGLRKDALVS